MLIEHRPTTDPELVTLATAQQRELRENDAGPDRRIFPPRANLRALVGTFLVGIVDGRVVACGGFQELPDGAAEITRMYVRPAYRGRGLARQLLVALEELATRGGYTVLRLATGSYLPVALALYTSAGYQRIPTYGEYASNPYSVCFEKRLPVPA
ncbi:GNAT family N-acetyltransferase [Rhizomonospora bruguierae]|uniref:GNAT family N-acetyltransferase n=1 Tax=Rhizomonospora bruguierae TaxID=1581705 RepID=UPI001BCAA207|nr:GNAT family N-acetyltransferase [Micromonospora sp. NBRC 107566]